MQCRGVARRCPLGSVTVLGDLAQGTTPWSSGDWHVTLAHLGKAGARIEPLTRGYRVPADVIAFANRLLPHLAVGLEPATSVRKAAGGLRVVAADDPARAAAVEAVRALAEEGSIGVIAADTDVPAVAAALAGLAAEHVVLGADDEDRDGDATRITVVPATLAKGLEYDQVVVAEPAAIVAAEPRGLRRLYVVLTRAVSRLVVVHGRPLPAELAA
jgi:DNA helicase IV